MGRTIRARVKNGCLEPLEKLGLPEGMEVEITIHEVVPSGEPDALESTAGGWKGLVDCEKLKRDIYADRLIQTRPVPRIG